MDTLSHALWGSGLFGYRGHRWLAVFFGAMPDLLSFGVLFFIKLFSCSVVIFTKYPVSPLNFCASLFAAALASSHSISVEETAL